MLMSLLLLWLFPPLASMLPCWSASSNVVLVRSSPTLRYLLKCGYLSVKPATLSTSDGYFPYEIAEGLTQMQTSLGLSKSGEEGVLEMLVIKEGKCFISEEDLFSLHESYIDNFYHSPDIQKSSTSSQCKFNALPFLIASLVTLHSNKIFHNLPPAVSFNMI